MAAPNHFFDPFYYEAPPAYEDHSTHKKLLLVGGPQAPSNSTPVTVKTLPVTGQGTIAIKGRPSTRLQITVEATNILGAPTLNLVVENKSCRLFRKTQAGHEEDIETKLRPGVVESDCYLNGTESDSVYWLSLDKNNGILRYGEHFTNMTCCLFEVVLKQEIEGVMVWTDPKDAWLESLKTIDITLDDGALQPVAVAVRALPVVIDLSPFIATMDGISLNDLERGTVTVPKNLPEACQKLYENVAGTKITLTNEGEEFDFKAAIERSIKDPNGWCYKTLEKKSKEFGDKDEPLMTYLRITLGVNQGNSPGIPYVLEIWPSGHYSPIHDHGKSCAVIKVLCGEVVATYYDSLHKPRRKVGEAQLKKGMITWLDPDNYQIHQLHNKSEGLCCTIQCYSYEDKDETHYGKFDYSKADESVGHFDPNSDMAFGKFYELMKAETEALRLPGPVAHC
ncbi:hypothetical protein BJ508DRAFT_417358 [Ascobolus immersus RN42]|uniref:Uncharacterized protein n=1 Tax=Ascobolus immersus RN42 TaxID=1160509 RepID=A0A3N4HTA2_ASCIM|nr:hypothetical protein BJ508DRAFT_417358 [Ascobolus immersus RN42]